MGGTVLPVKFTKELLENCTGKPPLGCRYCDRGAKMVLYITGICSQTCFYCPLSEQRKGKDVIFANERPVEGQDWLVQIIDEARRMRALGTGITGGDPMLFPERTEAVIRGLKGEFGKGHHIHLYTSGPFDPALIPRMAGAGLDEIRFHPPIGMWKELSDDPPASDLALFYADCIQEARTSGLSTGMEIPAVPDITGTDLSEGLEAVLDLAERCRLDFVNLNELEASHTNAPQLNAKGYELEGDSMAVAGSRELALRAMRAHKGVGPVIHFCSSVYKDSVQLRNRLKRTAVNVKRPYEVITDDGTLLRGVVVTGSPTELREDLMEEFEVPGDLIEALTKERSVLIAPWILEEVSPYLDEECYISERYPTWDALEVERIPLK